MKYFYLIKFCEGPLEDVPQLKSCRGKTLEICLNKALQSGLISLEERLSYLSGVPCLSVVESSESWPIVLKNFVELFNQKFGKYVTISLGSESCIDN